ncbi:MAG: hypothetical protein IKD08_06740, partial [Alphaproteobacteria bacterium]|nr:hypothetical protein [Alphaproteobacteria bacterium]
AAEHIAPQFHYISKILDSGGGIAIFPHIVDDFFVGINPESSKKAFSCQDFFCNSPNLSASERSKILRKAGEKQ